MSIRHNRTSAIIGALALVFQFIPTVYAGPTSLERESLPTGEISVVPPAVTVGEPSEHLISVEVTDPDLEFVNDRLILTQQHYRPNGTSIP